MTTLPEQFLQQAKTLMGEQIYGSFIKAMEEPPSVAIRLNPFKKPLAATKLTEESKEQVIVPKEKAEESKEQAAEILNSLFPDDSVIKPAKEEIKQTIATELIVNCQLSTVNWCPEGTILPSRPDFTLDPLLHAGCYYVQEASSMFVSHVAKHLVSQGFLTDEALVLDLCAAPGGKSTALRAALGDSSILIANETIRQRAMILRENIIKQGHPEVIVTNNYAADFTSTPLLFDAILADVPCSGEGMFRKDEGAIKQWTPELTQQCAQLQRQIIQDIWPSLKENGILIYSTCTYNVLEDEDNIEWICQNLGGRLIPIPVNPDWNITGPLKPLDHLKILSDVTEESKRILPSEVKEGRRPNNCQLSTFRLSECKGNLFTLPSGRKVERSSIVNCQLAYRFIPGRTPGEGLFMAVIQKTSPEIKDLALVGGGKKDKDFGKKKGNKGKNDRGGMAFDSRQAAKQYSRFIENPENYEFVAPSPDTIAAIPKNMTEVFEKAQSLHILHAGIGIGEIKTGGKDFKSGVKDLKAGAKDLKAGVNESKSIAKGFKPGTLIPSASLALSIALSPDAFPRFEADKTTALRYLRHEAITLPPDTPKGHVIITYKNHPLGFVKNIGQRANNLYPQEWRIRKEMQ